MSGAAMAQTITQADVGSFVRDANGMAIGSLDAIHGDQATVHQRLTLPRRRRRAEGRIQQHDEIRLGRRRLEQQPGRHAAQRSTELRPGPTAGGGATALPPTV